MRVKVAGLVAQTGPGATRLLGALRGMCSRYRSRTAHELVLRAPLGGGAGAQPLRLVAVLPDAAAAAAPPATAGRRAPPPAPSWWALRHESAALRGPAYAALPAAVREVAEARLHTPAGGGGGYAAAPGFAAALGAAVEAAVERRGNVYRCSHAGLPVDVEVSILSPLPAGAAEELARAGVEVPNSSSSAADAAAGGGTGAASGGAAAAKPPSSYTRGYYLVEAHITVAETMAQQQGVGGGGGAGAGGGAEGEAEGAEAAEAAAMAAAAAAAAAAGSLGEGAPLPLLPPGGHIEAAWALGAFAEKLLPMVRLQPAL
jgi:hypothetical protein